MSEHNFVVTLAAWATSGFWGLVASQHNLSLAEFCLGVCLVSPAWSAI